MNIQAMRERLAEISAKLNEFSEVENYTNEDLETINELNDEYKTLKANIEAKEKIEAIKAESEVSTKKVTKDITNKTPRVEAMGSKKDKFFGFENGGEYYKAVINQAKGRTDARFNNAAFEKYGEDGGFLVDADMRSEIAKKVQGDESLLPMTRQFQVSGNRLELPVNESAPWDATGIQAYWEEEGGSMTESKSVFKNFGLKLHKLTAFVKVSDELLEDAVALESWIKNEAPEAMMHKINAALISGSGAGQPEGFLNNGFKYQVAKEAGPQTADTIVYENIVKMESRFLPQANGLWLAHPQAKEQLRQLVDGNGNNIYMGGGAYPHLGAPGLETLMGKPIRYMMGGVKALGDEGDLSLVDFRYMYSAIKSGSIKNDMSIHFAFDQNLTCFRFVIRLAAGCPFTSPVSTENGSYDMSSFVTLEAR